MRARDFASLLFRFGADRRGAVAVEYAMIAVGVAAVIAATVFQLGDNVKTTFYDKLVDVMGK